MTETQERIVYIATVVAIASLATFMLHGCKSSDVAPVASVTVGSLVVDAGDKCSTACAAARTKPCSVGPMASLEHCLGVCTANLSNVTASDVTCAARTATCSNEECR